MALELICLIVHCTLNKNCIKQNIHNTWSKCSVFFISTSTEITVLSPPFLHFSTFLLSLFLPFFSPLCLHLSLPPSLSLPAKSASSHADLSSDRWSQAKSVYLHTAPNKMSRCLQSCRSPPITTILKQARQEEEEEMAIGRWGEISFARIEEGFLVLPSIIYTHIHFITLTVSTKLDFFWFLSPFHLSLFVFFIFLPSSVSLFLGWDVFKPPGVSGSHRLSSFSFLFSVFFFFHYHFLQICQL